MYSVSTKKKQKKKNKIDGLELISLDGFIMTSKRGITIEHQLIRNIKIVDKYFADRVVKDKVNVMYKKLIDKITELITSDDDSGSDLQEALNQIEKFRLEIKNKYRNYLKKEELSKMSSELSLLKKESEKRIVEINQNIMHFINTNGKSR